MFLVGSLVLKEHISFIVTQKAFQIVNNERKGNRNITSRHEMDFFFLVAILEVGLHMFLS